MTVSNYLANPLIRSIVYGGDCHMQVLLAARLFKGLDCAEWKAEERPFGPTSLALLQKLFEAGSKTGAGKKLHLGLGSEMTSLFVPLHTQKLIPNVTTTECHGTRHVCARGKRHEEQESRSLTSPLQMHARIQNVDLEAARWSFMKSDAPARAIILGSIVLYRLLGWVAHTQRKTLLALGVAVWVTWCTLLGIAASCQISRIDRQNQLHGFWANLLGRKSTLRRMFTSRFVLVCLLRTLLIP